MQLVLDKVNVLPSVLSLIKMHKRIFTAEYSFLPFVSQVFFFIQFFHYAQYNFDKLTITHTYTVTKKSSCILVENFPLNEAAFTVGDQTDVTRVLSA